MKPTRRQFLKSSAAFGALCGMGAVGPQWLGSALATPWQDAAIRELMLRNSPMATAKAATPMKILVLGGTAFLGPACVELMLARGHEVTLFNRGRTNAHLFPQLAKIEGDRREGHDALAGGDWDAVLDTSAYYPRVVDSAMDVLADMVDHYVLISTISVYSAFDRKGIDEDFPVATIEDETTEEVTGETYGALKALCEQAAEARMPGRVSTIRPGLIVGPMDRTDRFTYWPVRVSRGGEVLAPGAPSQGIQVIDVRDLAAFVVRSMEERIAGVFNATSPPDMFTMGGLLQDCRDVACSDATFTWASPEFLEEQSVAPWSEMPVWMPPGGEYAGFDSVDVGRALAAGMAIRPLEQTIRATLDWWESMPESTDGPRTELRAGIDPEKEQQVLEAWHARGSG